MPSSAKLTKNKPSVTPGVAECATSAAHSRATRAYPTKFGRFSSTCSRRAVDYVMVTWIGVLRYAALAQDVAQEIRHLVQAQLLIETLSKKGSD